MTTAKKGKPKALQARGKSAAPISQAERTEIAQRLAKRYEGLRKKYPEVHGKVVDFVSNSVEDGTLYFTIRFTDKTELTLQYRSRIMATGADVFDVNTGD